MRFISFIIVLNYELIVFLEVREYASRFIPMISLKRSSARISLENNRKKTSHSEVNGNPVFDDAGGVWGEHT